MVDIAEQGEGARVPLRAVAERQELSAKYLEQLAGAMVKFGLLRSLRGARGGYVLVRPANQITAGEILRASEGSCLPVECLEEGSECERAGKCNTVEFWKGFGQVIEDYVDSVTVADLARMPVPAKVNVASSTVEVESLLVPEGEFVLQEA